VINDEQSIDKCIEKLSSAIQELLSVVPVPTHRPLYPPELGTKYALKSAKEVAASHKGSRYESPG
jgi:hypothetical protein